MSYATLCNMLMNAAPLQVEHYIGPVVAIAREGGKNCWIVTLATAKGKKEVFIRCKS